MSKEDWSPRIQIRNGYAIGFSQYEGPKDYSRNSFKPEFKAYSGEMTAGSRKRVRKCIDLLLQISPERIIFNPVINDYMPFSVNFITLTLPTDQKIETAWAHKHLLEPFLRKLRNKHGVKHYVWKCELQERGQIHYHITTNVFILWTDIRNDWNNIISSAGLMKDFIIKHKHSNPNSTDIHAVYKIKNLAAYLNKYIMKSVGDHPIGAKVWDASQSLKSNKLFTTYVSHADMIKIDHATKRGDIIETDLPYVKILKPKSGSIRDVITTDTYQQYDSYIKAIARCASEPNSDPIHTSYDQPPQEDFLNTD